MKPRDIFGIVLRTAAVCLCIYGGWFTLAGIKYIPATFYTAVSGRSTEHNFLGYFVYGIPAVIAGVIVLRYAEKFLNFTCRNEKPPNLPKPSEQPTVKDNL